MTMVRLQNARRNDPVAIVRDLEEHLNRVFGGAASAEAWTPAVEVFETDEAYVVEADLPGFARDQVKIDVDDGILTIRAEMDESKNEEKDNFVMCERRYGKMRRSFNVNGVDESNITAEFTDGVLKLNLPKRAERQQTGRSIEIE